MTHQKPRRRSPPRPRKKKEPSKRLTKPPVQSHGAKSAKSAKAAKSVTLHFEIRVTRRRAPRFFRTPKLGELGALGARGGCLPSSRPA